MIYFARRILTTFANETEVEWPRCETEVFIERKARKETRESRASTWSHALLKITVKFTSNHTVKKKTIEKDFLIVDLNLSSL